MTEQVPTLDDYRAEARAWLAVNLERRRGPVVEHDVDHFTPEVMAESRARQRRLAEGGYAGITWPKTYGGQGLPGVYASAFRDEAAPYETPDFGILGGITFEVCIPTIIAHGSPELLARLVPRALVGEALVCQFFSEPSSGSDLAGARTRATRDGEQWVLNGQKIWSTFAHLADWGMCLARTNWDAPKHRGLTWFMVPCDAPGLTIRPIKQVVETSEFCEDFFDDVVVDDGDRIGEVDLGWSVTQTMLVYERGAAAVAAGPGRVPAGELAPDLVELASRTGRTADPLTRQRLARAHVNAYVGRSLEARIGEMARLGEVDAGVTAYAKLFKGIYDPVRGRLGVEIGSGGAMTWEPGDRAGKETSLAYLGSRFYAIAGGTNEMQRNGIGERMLGLPREHSFDTTRPFGEVLRDAGNWSGKV
jgi:alkylation response protein AidB-like acyl-CoA dehydrogenase